MKRQPSTTDIYHVILRGNNKEQIFNDDKEYKKFEFVMKCYQNKWQYEILAYCLMPNHIHICIKVEFKKLQKAMHDIELKFARWYNQKNTRVGHLFENRYKCYPVESEEYLLTLFRYIHHNPYNAKLENTIGVYPWSSYSDYMRGNSQLVNTDFITLLFKNRSEMLIYLNTPMKKPEEDEKIMNPENKDWNKIYRITGLKSEEFYQKLPRDKQEKILEQLYKNGLPLRAIIRTLHEPDKTLRKLTAQWNKTP